MTTQEYIVTVIGCDDSNSIEIALTDTEAAVIRRVAAAITSASSSGCEPRMRIGRSCDPEDEGEL